MSRNLYAVACCLALILLAAGPAGAAGEECPNGIIALGDIAIKDVENTDKKLNDVESKDKKPKDVENADKKPTPKMLEVQCPAGKVPVTVPAELQGAILWYQNYKQVNMSNDVAALIRIDNKKEKYTLGSIFMQASYARLPAFGILLGAFLLLLGAAILATHGQPLLFLVGTDGRYSNSQCQVAFWFATTMAVYVTVLLVRALASNGICWGGITIPDNLLTLSGISAFTFAAAKGITVKQFATFTAAARRPGAAAPPPPPVRALENLAQDNYGKFDLGDFQMIVVTLLVIGVYLVGTIKTLGSVSLEALYTMPDVDGALVSAFGLGQGAYLLKKLATPPGRG